MRGRGGKRRGERGRDGGDGRVGREGKVAPPFSNYWIRPCNMAAGLKRVRSSAVNSIYLFVVVLFCVDVDNTVRSILVARLPVKSMQQKKST